MFVTIWSVLSSSLLFWEIAGYVCTFVVILGCIGEYIAEFTGIPKSDERKHRISKLSLIILTMGIAGELLTAIRSSQISGEVISDLQTSVRDAKQSATVAADAAKRANTAAGEAKTKADAVGVEADKLDSRIDASNKQLDEVDAKRMQLEKELAWRDLTPEQIKAMVAVLSSSPESRVIVGVTPSDPEVRQYALAFFPVFGQAKWSIVGFKENDFGVTVIPSNSPSIPLNGVMPVGVTIRCGAKSCAATARVLHQALCAAGIIAPVSDFPVPGPGIDVVLVIGQRLSPKEQEEFKHMSPRAKASECPVTIKSNPSAKP